MFACVCVCVCVCLCLCVGVCTHVHPFPERVAFVHTMHIRQNGIQCASNSFLKLLHQMLLFENYVTMIAQLQVKHMMMLFCPYFVVLCPKG